MTDPGELLMRLQDGSAFDPVLLREALAGVHVPFESMTRVPLETPASAALGRTERLAVVGQSGSGKSSFIAHVLAMEQAPGAVRFAPIRVPVAAESTEVVTEPSSFALHVIRTVTAQAQRAGTIGQRRAVRERRAASPQTVTSGRRASAALRVPLWMTDVNIAGELSSLVQGLEAPTGAGAMAIAERLVVTLAEHGLFPIIVIDDSDAWLKAVGRDDLVVPFFGRIVPMLAKEWATGLVVAVHDEYVEHDTYPSNLGWLNHEVRLPALPDVASLARIVEVRAEAVLGHPQAADEMFTPEALAELFTQHRQPSHNIRKTMQDAHTALGEAVDAGASRIEFEHVRSALARQM